MKPLKIFLIFAFALGLASIGFSQTEDGLYEGSETEEFGTDFSRSPVGELADVPNEEIFNEDRNAEENWESEEDFYREDQNYEE